MNAPKPNNEASSLIKQPTKTITSSSFSAKFSSKSEVYRFLSAECGIYLPSYNVCTVDHSREVASNKRKILYSKDIKHISVPQFKGLGIDAMLDFAKDYPEVYQALPSEPRELDKLHRGYVANVIFTLVGQPFKNWINSVTEARNKKIIEEQDLNI